MKKILVFILVVSLCLSVCGCGNSDNTYVHNADADNSTSWPVQVPESDDEKYNRAVSLYNEQKYKEALSIFNEIAEYADSSEYRDSCYHNIAKAAAKENFAGYWCWVSGTYPASNAVYSWEHNPYDKFLVDFETMTITQYFASPALQFEKTHDFTIVNATCLKTTGFRLDSTTMYWHFVDGQVFVSSVSSVFDPNGKHQMPLMPVVE